MSTKEEATEALLRLVCGLPYSVPVTPTTLNRYNGFDVPRNEMATYASTNATEQCGWSPVAYYNEVVVQRPDEDPSTLVEQHPLYDAWWGYYNAGLIAVVEEVLAKLQPHTPGPNDDINRIEAD